MMPLSLALSALLAASAVETAAASSLETVQAREQVNFDFAWRFKLGIAPPPPPPPPGPKPPGPPPPPLSPAAKKKREETCPKYEKGVNYGQGSIHQEKTKTVAECCKLCADNSDCKAWDWNPASSTCYEKDNTDPTPGSTCPGTKCRYSGKMPSKAAGDNSTGAAVATIAAPAPPGKSHRMTGNPPESTTAFDDSSWDLVDTPHDMLINQKFSAANTKGMAYLPRNTGWYRKHFKLPAAWSGKSVWLYIEGSFHATTAFLNGADIGFHEAGYTSFWLRLDNTTVHYGDTENVLALYVDASFGTGWWYEGGGLIRHQYLVATDTTHLEPDGTWSYATDIGETKNVADAVTGRVSHVAASAMMHTSAEVTNHGKAASSVTVKATITDGATGASVATSTSAAASIPPCAGPGPCATMMVNTSSTIKDAKLWSVKSPTLYTVTVDVMDSSSGKLLDSTNYSVGVRTLVYSNKGLTLNDEAVKVRGFCDHSNFAGVGGAVPDRVNLYRVQMLRSVGGNAWRMAHNPPIPSRLDFMDRLGMLALDENRDFGTVGDRDDEPLPAQLTDMRDLIKRDRSHPSVMAWSFCNEGECSVPADSNPFRQTSYDFDGTREVTQNYLGEYKGDGENLDIQGFSHKNGNIFDTFHAAHPTQPMMATECCSCMSQRGVDTDACPDPKDGGCVGYEKAGLPDGTFYNNNIGKCTADQVLYSDSRDFVTGTFVWSGFDYYGEARGFPQNTKCRGTVSDLAGFQKETAYWLRSWWLSNISDTDAGKPPLDGIAWPNMEDKETTCFILEAWQPAPAVYNKKNREINVYTNAASVKLELNGKPLGSVVDVPFFGQATFNVTYAPGNLTAKCMDSAGKTLSSYSVASLAGVAASLELSLDAPSASTGTGTHLVADGEDVAMVRATLFDSAGNFANNATDNVTFSVVSGPGKIWATHNGNPADDSPRDVGWVNGYHGLARAFVRVSMDAATPHWHRSRMLEIDVESGRDGSVSIAGAAAATAGDIVLSASAPGIAPVQLTIPVSTSLELLPRPVASNAV